MPYEEIYVEPEVLLDYEGLKVYLTYKDMQANDPNTYWYSFIGPEGEVDFDVRELKQFAYPTGRIPHHCTTREYHRDVIREAIAHEELDELIDEAGYIPSVLCWPQEMVHLDAPQLQQLLREYDEYIQGANALDLYTDGWRPVAINEFYSEEFISSLEQLRQDRYKFKADMFAASLPQDVTDEEVVDDIIETIEQAKAVLKDDKEEAQ